MKPVPTILAAAFLIRAAIALAFPNIIAPDEVFQFLEQAHRLVFGQGVVPWEFQVGLRNWLIPLTLAVPMELAHLLIPNPLAGLILIRLLLCLASLPIVACATRWGERFYGIQGAWIAGLLAACWPDLWLMAPHPLEEILAADLLVPAVYLIGTAQTARRTAVIGLLLGLVFTLRLQLAPAIAIAGIALCGRHPRRWAIALPAAALPVLAAGLLDWYTWGQPFRSFWLNIYLNLVLHVAKTQFGGSPPWYFLFLLALSWFWSLPVIAYLFWQGVKKLPMPGTMAAIIILTHSLISHKEYRFIFPAIAFIIPLAGVGLAGLTSKLSSVRMLTQFRIGLGLILLAGPLASPWIYFMLRFQTSSFRVFTALASRHPTLVSLQGWTGNFNSYLPLDLVFTSHTKLTSQTGIGPTQADAIVAILPARGVPRNFSRQSCYPRTWIPFAETPSAQICIWFRPESQSSNAVAPSVGMLMPTAAIPFIVPDRLDP